MTEKMLWMPMERPGWRPCHRQSSPARLKAEGLDDVLACREVAGLARKYYAEPEEESA